ncbi:MAG TPA: zinc-dependent metalloprotease [Acidimicrobiales bacterium]|nr:zinc-dependent metalloprotease [Acidimicrobiales bacterium]
MTEAISWDVAQRVAARIGGQEPLASSYHFASLQPDFEELTAEAEVLVSEATGLHSLAGPARARVIDRAGWVRVNIGSFQRLLRPITEKLGSKVPTGRLGPVSRTVTGAQLGTMLGWMSTRVLGQYDLLLVEEERPDDQDIVYYVGSNILAMEKRFGFPPREFRLWLALHEVTHRTQFTGVPWLRPHFLDLVERFLGQVNPDPRSFVEALRRAVGEARAGRNPLAEGGLVMLLAGPEQQSLLRKVTGMMSLLEGHGDVVMDRAGAERIPSAARFSRVLHERRANVKGPARLLQQLIGLEAKLQQYELGERFIEQVEAAGGKELFDRVWEGPEWLPDLVEIRDPSRWIERARAGVPAPG